MPSRQSDHPASVVTLSAAQFDKIVELLTPGYELAKRYLEQASEKHGAHTFADNTEFDLIGAPKTESNPTG